MIIRLLLFAVLCVVACNAYFFLEARLLGTAGPDTLFLWVIPILISAGIGFAMGLWRRGNPLYVYVVAALICLATPWSAFFFLGLADCMFVSHCT